MANTVIGLTGGIGSGKSAAADRFEEHGITTVDADIASRAVVEPGTEALAEIARHFGQDILLPEGTLDRTKLRHKVFAEPVERKWLQGLLHPRINAYLREHLQASTSAYAMLVNPLLFETRQHGWCFRTLVIDVPESLQLQRTMSRDNNTQEQVENIMRAQLPRAERLAMADDIIVNDQGIDQLHHAVDTMHEKYLEMVKEQ